MEIKKKMMMVKDKAIEAKEKTKVWCKERMAEIIVYGGSTILIGAGYFMGHMIGHSEGWLDGSKEGYDAGVVAGRLDHLTKLLKEFGITPESGDTTICIRNTETGYLDAICSKDFHDLLATNDTIVHYGDGTFEFGSEVENK